MPQRLKPTKLSTAVAWVVERLPQQHHEAVCLSPQSNSLLKPGVLPTNSPIWLSGPLLYLVLVRGCHWPKFTCAPVHLRTSRLSTGCTALTGYTGAVLCWCCCIVVRRACIPNKHTNPEGLSLTLRWNFPNSRQTRYYLRNFCAASFFSGLGEQLDACRPKTPQQKQFSPHPDAQTFSTTFTSRNPPDIGTPKRRPRPHPQIYLPLRQH
ncbi:hypothetical protein GGR51DRAFT_395692 [Nemania sp. FL0031]|nr:hypothetical protein GGR51DRAFT_395692 [Nemania sp. FL0031]